MPATWPRCSIPWLVTPFPSSGYQPQFLHREATVPQEYQMGLHSPLFASLASEVTLALQRSLFSIAGYSLSLWRAHLHDANDNHLARHTKE